LDASLVKHQVLFRRSVTGSLASKINYSYLLSSVAG
jgi:hypothetical protein